MTVRQLESAPALGRLYARAAMTARGRHGDQLPDTSYELASVSIDLDRLLRYEEVCGFRHSDQLPPTYPHVLGFPVAAQLMIEPAFPFPLPGMVHLQNHITQDRPIKADEKLTVRVRSANLRDHPRGRQFDMITEASVGGGLIWTETSTYLRRERVTPSPSGGWQGGGNHPTSIWRIPADIGRRYAAVSGDVNPIHLNPLIARLFGFRRAIAHGMWLKARCLAALEGRLSERLTVDVEFKSPLLLPSTVAFTASGGDDRWSMRVFDLRGERPHLQGSVN